MIKKINLNYLRVWYLWILCYVYWLILGINFILRFIIVRMKDKNSFFFLYFCKRIGFIVKIEC